MSVFKKYDEGMKKNKKGAVKSSITLPPRELEVVKKLKRQMQAKTYVEVIRTGLILLEDSMDRKALKENYRLAADRLRLSTLDEIADLEALGQDGLEEENEG